MSVRQTFYYMKRLLKNFILSNKGRFRFVFKYILQSRNDRNIPIYLYVLINCHLNTNGYDILLQSFILIGYWHLNKVAVTINHFFFNY